MTVTQSWIIYAVLVMVGFCAGVGAGWSECDSRWTQRDTDRQMADAKASHALSEQYRIKERKLNETIGYLETKGINNAAQAEAKHRDVIDRLRNPERHPTDGLRVKPALACRAVPNNTTTPGNGHEEVQAGLSAEVAGNIIGTGAECDQVVLSLEACQAYAGSLQK